MTSSVSRKRASPCANRPCWWCCRGGDGIRTRVDGFAGRCLASRPLHRSLYLSLGLSRADDGTRTRDPHLGKVMRYQLRYVRVGGVAAKHTTIADSPVLAQRAP